MLDVAVDVDAVPPCVHESILGSLCNTKQICERIGAHAKHQKSDTLLGKDQFLHFVRSGRPEAAEDTA